MSPYMVIIQNVVYYLLEGDLILFDKIPVPTIELHESRSQTSFTYPCPRSLLESRTALRIKHSQEEQAIAYRMSCEIKTP